MNQVSRPLSPANYIKRAAAVTCTWCDPRVALLTWAWAHTINNHIAPAGDSGAISFGLVAVGGVPEWLKGTDCKSVGFAYAGSNPAPSTIRD